MKMSDELTEFLRWLNREVATGRLDRQLRHYIGLKVSEFILQRKP